MSYSFIDRIARIEANRQIVTLKNITLSDEVFRDHFPGRPVLPGSMLIEALAQAATALLEISSNHRSKALPVMIDQVKFRAIVVPGDQLKVGISFLSGDASTAVLDGTIHVSDRLVTTARLTFAYHDAGQFYPAHAQAWVRAVYDFWLRDAEVIPSQPVRT